MLKKFDAHKNLVSYATAPPKHPSKPSVLSEFWLGGEVDMDYDILLLYCIESLYVVLWYGIVK
jgi:hypothetical protein